MPDASVYMIASFVIDDPDVYRAYAERFFPVLERYGGEFLTYDDDPLTFEGDDPPRGRVVIFRFPSEEAARGWYEDSEYQAISAHRRAGSTLRFLTLVRSSPPWA